MRHLLRTVSLPRLIEHPLRTFLTIIGISLGVAANISVQMILDTMSDSFTSMIDAVSGKVALQISGGETGVAEEVYDRLQARDENGRPPVPGLLAAMPTIQCVTKYGDENFLILAIDTLNDAAARDYKMTAQDGVSIDDPLTFLNSENSILLNKDFASRLGVKAEQTIDLLTSTGRKSFIVRGLLDASGPASAFGGNFALMDVYAAQKYFGRGPQFDSIDLLPEPGANIEALARATEAFLDGRYEVRRPQQRNEGVDSLLRNLKMGLTVMMLVVLAMGGFIIFNTVTTSVYQRIREIGLLRMAGVTRSGIWGLLLAEGLLLGFLGSVLGVLGGYFLGRFTVLRYAGTVSSLFVPANTSHVVFSTAMAIKGAALGLGITIVGALWPAFRATSITPLQVLRFGPGLSSGRRAALFRWLLLAVCSAIPVLAGLYHPRLRSDVDGVRIAMASLIVLGIAVTPIFMGAFLRLVVRASSRLRTPLVRLASENILRDLGRSAMTVAAFMVALAVMFEIYLFMNSMKTEMKNWLDDILKADLFITSSGNFATRTSMPVDPSLGLKIESVPGVRKAVEQRVKQVDYEGSRILILALNVKKYLNEARFLFADGYDAAAVDGLVKGRGVLLSKNLIMRNPKLKTAKTIDLMTPSGRVEYPILGVLVDYTSETGTVLFDRELYLRDYQDPLVDTFHVYAEPGTNEQTLRRSIDSLVGDGFNLFVLTNREFKGAVLNAIDQIFALAVSLEILTLIIAVIGIVNNLLAAVIDRTREIGVLRSLGATRSQIAAVFFIQSALMGFCGAVVGVVCGWGLGNIHMRRLALILSGWEMPLHYSVPLIVATFFASVAAAAIAGLFPATRAARLTLHEALKYE